MGYTLDLAMEKLLHSLQELIIFRRKFADTSLETESAEMAILNDIILDLAEGIAQYSSHPDPGGLAKEIRACHFTWDLAKLFKHEGLERFLCPPYFSQKDLSRLSE